MRPWSTLLLVLTVLVLGFSISTWAVFCCAQPHGRPRPRPMFSEWGSSEWGAGWHTIPTYTDDRGVGLDIDPTLNIVVVFAVSPDDREVIQTYVSQVTPDYAVLRLDTPYQTTVEKTAGVLVWVEGDQRSELRVYQKVGQELLVELRRQIHEFGRVHDAFGTLSRLYRGPDRSELTKLIEQYSTSQENRVTRDSSNRDREQDAE